MPSSHNKYFSISETAELTGLSNHRLRYIEKSNPLIKTIKIRDRRYYTIEVINYIKKMYNHTTTSPLTESNEKVAIIHRIDIILNKLKEFI
ncbi:MAG: MerR family transcriptional regulator [Rickettsiaceae bacterium]|nr:MerR family transcriptional regulator [Rickettsiaceae bacterium]